MNFFQYVFGIDKEDKPHIDKEDLKFRQELKEKLRNDKRIRDNHVETLNGGEEFKDFYKGVSYPVFLGSAIQYSYPSTAATYQMAQTMIPYGIGNARCITTDNPNGIDYSNIGINNEQL